MLAFARVCPRLLALARFCSLLHAHMRALSLPPQEGMSYEHIGSLERNEITALINSLYYFADSIIILNK